MLFRCCCRCLMLLLRVFQPEKAAVELDGRGARGERSVGGNNGYIKGEFLGRGLLHMQRREACPAL